MRLLFTLLFCVSLLPPVAFAAIATSPGSSINCSGKLTTIMGNNLSISCGGNLSISGGKIAANKKVRLTASRSLNLDNLSLIAPAIDLKSISGQLAIGDGTVLDSMGGPITISSGTNNINGNVIIPGGPGALASGGLISLLSDTTIDLSNPVGSEIGLGSIGGGVLLDHDPGSIRLVKPPVQYLTENGNAELGVSSASGLDSVNIPTWKKIGKLTVVNYGAPGGFPSITDPGPKSRGKNFFAGGPDNAVSRIFKIIDISSLSDSIDKRGVTFKLAGFFGGFLSQNDNAVLTAIFLDQANNPLNSVTVGGIQAAERKNLTGLLPKNMVGEVPVNTRSVKLILKMTRVDGVYNDGYADNLSLQITAP